MRKALFALLLLSWTRSALHQRSLHAHRSREFLSAQRNGPQNARQHERRLEQSITSKAEVINWLKRSLDAVKSAHLAVTPKDLERKVHIADRDATVDGMYLRILVHANEHMGQLIAYARMSGVAPPWSKNQ
jgi:uncharacterized damage-inducible protein DinB